MPWDRGWALQSEYGNIRLTVCTLSYFAMSNIVFFLFNLQGYRMPQRKQLTLLLIDLPLMHIIKRLMLIEQEQIKKWEYLIALHVKDGK